MIPGSDVLKIHELVFSDMVYTPTCPYVLDLIYTFLGGNLLFA
jgi:hypothetical protein